MWTWKLLWVHSVVCPAQWLLLHSLSLLGTIVELMQELYTDRVSSLSVKGTLSDWFPITCGVRQRCTIAQSLSLPPMDWILEWMALIVCCCRPRHCQSTFCWWNDLTTMWILSVSVNDLTTMWILCVSVKWFDNSVNPLCLWRCVVWILCVCDGV